MRMLKLLGFILIFSFYSQSAVFAESITVACSSWKPFYYSEDGDIKGAVYDIAKLVVERAQMDAKFIVAPWKRVYETGLNKPDYMISCISRTPKRESLFHWIGAVKETTYYNFYKLKTSDIAIGSSEDTLQYKVGVMRGSLTEDHMNSIAHKNLHIVTEASSLVKLLAAGRVDLVLEAPNVITNESAAAGIDPEVFELAFQAYGVTTSLSLGKSTSPAVVQKLKDAYKSLEAEGKLTFAK
ncbi:MAG: transporter substrate-binding domain-containing protein [Desulfobacterales bacterium]|nr:transporter substrate-binding domain-containing protein [Desulfobacterales bacterium]